MIAVIYTRVSTDDQAHYGVSLQAQKKECIAFAKSQGYSVEKVFIESGHSAKSAMRPVFQDMLKYCYSKQSDVSAVIVWKMDRFARNTSDHLILKSRLKESGIRLLSASERIDDSGMGNMMETLIAAIAEFENQNRADRTILGMTERLKHGSWTYSAPIGYKNIKDSLGRPTVEPLPSAVIVKQILETFSLSEISIKKLAELATELGLTTNNGGKISIQTMSKMVRNPLYAGIIQSSLLTEPVEGIHKALISEETYLKNQRKLSGLKFPYNPKDEMWPLRGGLIVCEWCKMPLTGGNVKGRNKYYAKYNCRTCRKSLHGIPTSIDREVLHREFSNFLKGIQITSEVESKFRIEVLKRWKEATATHRLKLETLEQQLAEYNRKKDNLLELFISSKVSELEKTKKTAEYKTAIVDLELQIESSKNFRTNINQVVEFCAYFLKNLSPIWNKADYNSKIALQRLIFPEGVFYEFGKGFRTTKLSDIFRFVEESISDKSTISSSMVIPRGIEPRLPG